MVPPQKKRKVSLTDEFPEDSVVLYERWDFDILNSINELELEPELERVVHRVLSSYTEKRETYRMVVYTPREFKQGRLYGLGLQGIDGWVRRLCSYKSYHDVDVVNCGPTLLLQILQIKTKKCPQILQEYVDNRSAMFQQARDEEPYLQDVTDKQLKKLFLVGVHGGKHYNQYKKLGLPLDHPIKLLSKWETDIQKAVKKLMKHPNYKKMAKKIKKLDKKSNKEGTFASWCWQIEENRILMSMLNYLRKHEKLTPGALCFDGIMVERSGVGLGELDPAILRRTEGFIEQQTGFKVELSEKSLIPTQEDWAKYWGPKSLQKIVSLSERPIYLLIRAGQLSGHKRHQDWLMTPHSQIPGVYLRSEQDTDFINNTLRGYNLFRCGNMKSLTTWFQSVDHPKFELLTQQKIRRDVMSFLNGFLDLNTLCFCSWQELTGPVPLTDHFFEREMELSNAMDAATPLWDNLLSTQLGETSDMFEILVGRCFYPIGTHDNWQVLPFIKGDANTGKSTLCDLVKKMFPVGSVGVITATQEEKFGLESLYQKRLVLVPDLPKKFHKLVNQSDFQSMATGESVSIARKNKTAICDQEWRVPAMMAGNYLPQYNDNSGSVSRRLVVFLFDTLITSRDTRLKDKIIEQELVTVLLRCLVKYRNKCSEVEGQGFWEFAPQALKNVQDEVKESTNYLASFLANGDDYYQIVHHLETSTTLEELNKAFSNHMRFVHKIEKATIGCDRYPIKAAGFTVSRENLCKICHKTATKRACGSHYNANNRYKKWVIKGMSLERRKNRDMYDCYNDDV